MSLLEYQKPQYMKCSMITKLIINQQGFSLAATAQPPATEIHCSAPRGNIALHLYSDNSLASFEDKL